MWIHLKNSKSLTITDSLPLQTCLKWTTMLNCPWKFHRRLISVTISPSPFRINSAWCQPHTNVFTPSLPSHFPSHLFPTSLGSSDAASPSELCLCGIIFSAILSLPQSYLPTIILQPSPHRAFIPALLMVSSGTSGLYTHTNIYAHRHTKTHMQKHAHTNTHT